MAILEGPIPGENFTSDTKNYAWHRPPQFTDLNEAFEYIAEHCMDEDVSVGILTMIEMGGSIASITDMILTAAIGGGKITPDYSLILAGPIAHMICIMANEYGVDFSLGLDEGRKKPNTKVFLDQFNKIDPAKAAEISQSMGEAMGLPTEAQEAAAPEGEMEGPAKAGATGLGAPPAGLGAPPPAPAPAPAVEPAPPEEQEQMLGA